MDSLFNYLTNHVDDFSGPLLVGVILCLLLASGMGLPLPEDIPLLLAGYLCYLGKTTLHVVIPLTIVAVLGADSFIYLLGRRYGEHVPRIPLLGRHLTPPRLERARKWFHRRSGMTLFVGRFLPGLRAPIFLTAGIFKLPYWKFLAFDGSAALISVPVLVFLAYHFGEDIDGLRRKAEEAQLAIGVTLGLIVLGFIAWKVIQHRRARVGGNPTPRLEGRSAAPPASARAASDRPNT